MRINRSLVILEIVLLVLPALLLSAIWVFNMAGLIYELFGDFGAVYFSQTELFGYFFHLGLGLLSHTAVWAVLYLTISYARHGLRSTNKNIHIMMVLVKCGIIITFIGIVMQLLTFQGIVKKDFYQVFGIYCCGAIALLPAAHMLVINRANNQLQPTADASTE